MKRLKMLSLCLVAVAAVIGSTSASALATPTIQFVGKSATTYAVRANSCRLPRPTGVVPGEEMLMLVYVEDPENKGAFTLSSSGWQEVEKVENRSTSMPFQLAVFSKRYEAGDPSEYTVTWSGSTYRGCGGLAAAWSGVSKSEPINAHLGAASAGYSRTVRGPSVTTTKPNSMVVMLGDYNAYDTRTAPPGMEDIAGPEGVIAQILQPEAKATGDKSATTLKPDGNVGFVMALTPETTSEPPPPPSVTNVNPGSGPAAGGTSVTITGTNLSGASAVQFGASSATNVTVNSASSITATAPAGSGTVDVSVTTPGGTSAASAADHFSYTTTTSGIQFVGKSATTYAVRANSCRLPRPTGVVPGEEMLMLVYVEDPENKGAFTLSSSGWQEVEKVENRSTSMPFQLAVFSKRYEAGDPSEYTVTWSGSTYRGCGGLAAAWSGVSKSEPINAHLGAASAGYSRTVRGPSVTTTKPNSMVVMLGDYNAYDTRTAPPGMEDIAGPEGVIAQILQPEAKATGDKSATTLKPDGNVGFVMALTPE